MNGNGKRRERGIKKQIRDVSIVPRINMIFTDCGWLFVFFPLSCRKWCRKKGREVCGEEAWQEKKLETKEGKSLSYRIGLLISG